jgi:hypothetical protein
MLIIMEKIKFEHLAPVSASTIQRRFGGWNAAKRKADEIARSR